MPEEELTLLVDLGLPQEVVLQIDPAADPFDTARRFCYKHNLDLALIPVLGSQVQRHLADHESPECGQSEREETAACDSLGKDFVPQICGRSRVLVEKQGRREPVHARLYKEAGARSERSIGAVAQDFSSLLCKTNSPKGKQPLLQLYEKGMKKLMQKELRIQRHFQSQVMKELESLQEPQINQKSRAIAEEVFGGQLNHSISRMEYKKKMKAEKIVAEKERKELQECTFQPKVNPRSASACPKRSHHHCREESTFRPRINELSEIIVGDVSFQQRQKQYEVIRAARTQSVHRANQQKENYDPQSGSPLFHPQVGRGPSRRDKKAVYERLYESHFAKKEQPKEEPQPKQNSVYDSAKFRRILLLFEQLDSDKDGEIDAMRIDISSVDPDSLEVLAPVLAEMEELQVKLTVREFIAAVEKLMAELSIVDKRRLLFPAKPKQPASEYSFRPQINEKSRVLARRVRPDCSQYQLQARRKEVVLLQIEKLRVLREEHMLKECTFWPNKERQ